MKLVEWFKIKLRNGSLFICEIHASNEYPEEDEGLEAMFDRLLLRYEVKPVKDRNNFISMLKGEGQSIEMPSLTLDELQELQFYTALVSVSDQIYETIADINQDLNDEAIYPSARRLKNSIDVLKAKAFMDGRNNVIDEDLTVLEHILWNDIEEKEDATKIIKKHAQDKIKNTIERVKRERNELIFTLENEMKDKNKDINHITEIPHKLKELHEELIKLEKNNRDRKDLQEASEMLRKDREKASENVLLPI